ncbi:hypothetical protein EMIHUDRAFT_450438 [Emiliania huxleyi CCMP1516]|uniref:PX domain-containing protein n=2 Tax=Emiliania huxleyi TaxID=2903 RepID=A0A0D3JNK6_EMIH1|nr:hypothetical protein EMIHUDRAFT_450438 [Emiliania huxleyi CCMP1516]EOD25091.1 hypothetical protein EMIHUDRAFT_450438 [Emiliania huxleyi CCMP1516]|eukprot:XP_005777520.1 hypothetical protein EMIHUDRAFT_450438 [Emiliania huxleyi CCMP1516]
MEFSIESTSTLFDSSGKPYTSYSITTHYQGQRFQAQRRYREFVALHDGLRGEVSGLPHHFPVWPFHLNRLAPEVVDGRRVALCSYLSAALAALHGGVMPARLRSFLQLPQAQANRMTAPAGPSGAAPLLPLEKSDTVILVAYQLPLTVSRAEGGGWEVEWDDESVLNQHALSLGCRVMWVGGVGCAVDPDEEEGLAQLLLEGYSCLPVFLPAALTDRFYHGFCRSYLRPVFHNRMRLPDSENPFCEEGWRSEDWRAYSAANRKFADTVMEVYEPGHMVWAHDYHLLLLPSFLLRRHRTAHIGLFLHSPFPASDVFRSVAVREELLRAMLHADMVGFLLFEYTRNFLTSCKRLLGLEHDRSPPSGGFLGVDFGGRHVIVQVSTFGVSPSLLENHLPDRLAPPAAASTRDELKDLRAELDAPAASPRRLLAGVDYLDRFKGVQLKLLAWEAMLAAYPRYRAGHTLVMVASRNQVKLVADARDVRADIETIVRRIRASYPGALHYAEVERLSLAARMQLWQMSDVIVYSTVREAVNAHPLEYGLVEEAPDRSAMQFSGSLVMNPFSTEAVMGALETALEMPPAEKEARARKDLAHIRANTAEDWARQLLLPQRSPSMSAPSHGVVDDEARRFLTDLKSMQRKKEDHWMAVLLSYRAAAQRVVLLDWGGTLTPADTGFYDVREEGKYEVPSSVLTTLRQLCADPHNHVDAAFGSVPGLSLAVEHGFHYRIKSGPWQQLLPGVNTSWREAAEAVMAVYTTRTLGAYMQKKGSSMSWNFSSADPEFGALQARELQYQLQAALEGAPVVVRVGKGYVEACPKGIDKGVMAERFVGLVADAARRGRPAEPLQFVLCVGDDSSDELMFAALQKRKDAAAGRGGAAPGHDLFTATVGRKPSDASAYLADHADVVELLGMLSGVGSSRSKRFASAGDLQSLAAAAGGAARPQQDENSRPPPLREQPVRRSSQSYNPGA